eukprot:TRINITY_DN310_c0_g1_i5.p1 TRINITY_DN310_c0_g1~~TRINITY_DN310_c0_g1_i5.p1  ORF type:complete len:82 (+),score=47.76 TRINITY_DN310_c0_g1_i5:56-301(+)
MINDEGQLIDLYIPRKCSATNRLITSDDNASIQVNIGNVNEKGLYTKEYTTFAFTGLVRARGETDAALNRLAISAKIMKDC